MNRKNLLAAAHVCALIIVPGLAAWLTGQPFIFPSLGPTAFALVFDRRDASARQVVGSHLIGVASGLVAYQMLAHGLTLAALRPGFSMDGLRIVASSVFSIGLTTLAMVALHVSHAPACATTLIVSSACCPRSVTEFSSWRQ